MPTLHALGGLRTAEPGPFAFCPFAFIDCGLAPFDFGAAVGAME
ncbi:MAG TPA: hypothetical protein VNW92_12690 [Polyangiaceae bacterium]|nr:hypothetical protein [Polyangiaceae bacterium]